MRQKFSTLFTLLVGCLILLFSVQFALSQSSSDAILTHSRTAFPLTGAHVLVECTKCHVDYVFKGIRTDCIICHQDNEIHEGQLGSDCATCHTADSWKLVTFDHNQTDYALTGAHITASCDQCHENNNYKGTATRCIACHWNDTAHDGKLGTDCAACHSPGLKEATFNHSQSSFPLTGVHASAGCADCHVDNIYKGTPQECVACHQTEDAHDGQLGADCGACHTPGWRQAFFDHTQTGYTLIGAHSLVRCTQCHVDNVYKNTPQDCVLCHLDDDAHDGQFGTNCGACHSPGWQQATIDHSVTDFPLNGAHAAVGCNQCHPNSVYTNTPQDCFACHQDNDAHDGARGTNCAICHTPDGWK